MSDLTVLYLTANEMPEHWMKFQLHQLQRATNGLPTISVSRRAMTLGRNIVENDRRGYWNIYRQMLRAAKLAETPYVAMAEDDVLYPPQHFHEFRPPSDAVSYNRARWSLFVWDPLYCLRQRVSNCTLIAPRELLIEALEERMAKHPDGDSLPNQKVGEVGREKVERRLGVTVRKAVEWWSTVPVVQLNHPQGIDIAQQKQRKMHGQLKAYDIPYWGKAKDIVAKYDEMRG